jgi:hypothetical protein
MAVRERCPKITIKISLVNIIAYYKSQIGAINARIY